MDGSAFPPPQPQQEQLQGPSQDEKTWGLLAHLGALMLGFWAPLIVLIAKGNTSPWVRAHAVESLNFQITVFIALMVSAVLCIVLVGFVMLAVVGIGALVLEVIAGLQASNGGFYRYPMTIRLVK